MTENMTDKTENKTEKDKARIQKLRRKYADNPPEGYSKAEIERMRDDDLLDMDYFLHEFNDGDWD
jgi:hypothetical protein